LVLLVELPDHLEVKLQEGNRVLELELLKYFWVQYADASDILTIKHNTGTSHWEEHWIFIVLLERPCCSVDFSFLVVGLSANLGHQKAEGTVDHLEGGLSIKLHNAYLPMVLSSSICLCILSSSITYLEESLRDSFILVRLQCLQQSWNK